MGHVTLTTSLLGVVCHPKAWTLYSPPPVCSDFSHDRAHFFWAR